MTTPSTRTQGTRLTQNFAQFGLPATIDLSLSLRQAGLRPTRQRLLLAEMLFLRGHRHVTAEELHQEVTIRKEAISLATIYNCLHQFVAAGLLRSIAIRPGSLCFDTNTSVHHHIWCPETDMLIDIPLQAVRIQEMPAMPEGYQLCHAELVMRVQKL